jgi:hypothetical protein
MGTTIPTMMGGGVKFLGTWVGVLSELRDHNSLAEVLDIAGQARPQLRFIAMICR